jgi:hypothetical protein
MTKVKLAKHPKKKEPVIDKRSPLTDVQLAIIVVAICVAALLLAHWTAQYWPV